MDKRYFIELTNRLYRLTFFFPQKEPLRYKIREVADEILANVTLILEGDVRERRESAFVVEGDIEILLTLLELAKSQNWTQAREIDRIVEDYDLIKKEVEDFNEFTRKKQKMHELPASGNHDVHSEGVQKGYRGETRHADSARHAKASAEESQHPSCHSEASAEESRRKPKKLNKRQEKILELLKKQEKIQVQDIQKVIPKTIKRTLRRDLGNLMEQGMLRREGSGKMTYYARIGH